MSHTRSIGKEDHHEDPSADQASEDRITAAVGTDTATTRHTITVVIDFQFQPHTLLYRIY